MDERETLARFLAPHAFTGPIDGVHWMNLVAQDEAKADAYRRADIVLASDWLREHDERVRAEGRKEVGEQVGEWAMKNEIAAPPLDWMGLGGIIRNAVGEDDDSVPRCESEGCTRGGYIKSERYGALLCPRHAVVGPE